jgi:hypothetical protein
VSVTWQLTFPDNRRQRHFELLWAEVPETRTRLWPLNHWESLPSLTPWHRHPPTFNLQATVSADVIGVPSTLRQNLKDLGTLRRPDLARPVRHGDGSIIRVHLSERDTDRLRTLADELRWQNEGDSWILTFTWEHL